jgi:Phage capsid family
VRQVHRLRAGDWEEKTVSETVDWEEDDDPYFRPYGAKPYGGKPYGGKPYGGKPYGGKPYGGKPYGGKPYGGKPYGAKRADDDAGFLDPEEWCAEIAELFYEYSAVMRLGASVVSTDSEVWISRFDPIVRLRPAGGAPAAAGRSTTDWLRPSDNVLEAAVAVPNGVVRGIEADSEQAYTLKTDLAYALALGADQAFLSDAGLPRSLGKKAQKVAGSADPLDTARKVLKAVRASADEFRCPGWVLSPGALERLSTLLTDTGLKKGAGAEKRSLDTFAVLRLDGADGGTLLGYPFVVSLAAAGAAGNKERGKDWKETAGTMYFAADWEEACVGVQPFVVTVDAPAEPAVADSTLIRASMPLDFLLRRDEGFARAALA